MNESITAFAEGFTLNLGLIIAIGAQNAFVLAQGLTRRFVLIVALTSSVCDALLICAGIFFAAIATTAGGWAVNSLLVAGAGYLLWFGAKAAKASWRGDSLSAGGMSPKTAKGAFAASLALSLLNPHAILDMSIIFGGIAAQMPTEEKPFFALGGIIMSFVWFFALGFGAEKLSPWLTKPVAWRFINGGIALLMVSIAAALLTKLVTETLL